MHLGFYNLQGICQMCKRASLVLKYYKYSMLEIWIHSGSDGSDRKKLASMERFVHSPEGVKLYFLIFFLKVGNEMSRIFDAFVLFQLTESRIFRM